MSITYVTLVNSALQESGTETRRYNTGGSDFSTITDSMMVRFKTWVARAYSDIQQRAYDWEFNEKRGMYVISPRILAVNGIGSVVAGVLSLGPVSGTAFQTVNCIGGQYINGTVSGVFPNRLYADLNSSETAPITFNLHANSEKISIAGNLAIALVESWGSYNFSEQQNRPASAGFSDIREINQQTFQLADYGATAAEGSGNPQQKRLSFIPWETFTSNTYDFGTWPCGQPLYVTEDFEGRYRFWPAPEKDYTVTFNYSPASVTLSLYNDTISLIPDELADIVMWRALIYYGEYDEQPSVVARATRHYNDLLTKLEHMKREKAHFKPRRLY